MNFLWVVLTLFVAFCAAIWRIIVKTKVDAKSNALAFTVITEFCTGFIALFFLPFAQIKFPTDFSLYLLLFGSVLFGAFGDYLLIYASKKADVADAAILLPLNNIYVLIAAVLLYKESFTINKIAGVLAIAGGSILTLYKSQRLVFNRGILAVVIYGFLITGTILIDKGISSQFALPIYSGISYITSGIVLGLCIRRNIIASLTNEWLLNGRWSVVVGGIWAVFSLALLYAYGHGEASRIIPFMRIFIVMTTFYSILVLKETDRLWQKIFGSIIVTIGALMLVYN